MNEPLNTSLTSINFFRKSCNFNPLYKNQPLRLTPEQTSNPTTVFDDFFLSYDLMRQGDDNQTKTVREKPTCTTDTNTPIATRFSKPPRLIEKATSQPIEVINEVFDQVTLSDLIDDLLPNWLRVAVINTQSPYSYENGRECI